MFGAACLNTFSQVGLVVGHGTEQELTVCLSILDLFCACDICVYAYTQYPLAPWLN